jgi:hypothetical protein
MPAAPSPLSLTPSPPPPLWISLRRSTGFHRHGNHLEPDGSPTGDGRCRNEPRKLVGGPEDVVTNLCNNFDGVPVPFSVCVQVAILNNGGIPRKQGPWVLSELDAPWDS